MAAPLGDFSRERRREAGLVLGWVTKTEAVVLVLLFSVF